MEHLQFSWLETILMVLIFIGSVYLFAKTIRDRWQLLMLGKPVNRLDQPTARLKQVLKFALAQYRMPEERIHGILHLFIFYGFIVVSIRTLMLFGQTFFRDPDFSLFLFSYDSVIGRLYALLKDVFTVLVIVGVVGAAYRRLVIRERRLEGKQLEPVAILAMIFMLMVTDLTIEAVAGYFGHSAGWWAPFSLIWKHILDLFGLADSAFLYHLSVWLHLTGILAFLNYLPFGKHFHIITSIPSVYVSNLDPSGMAHRIPNIEEQEQFGASKISHLNRKEILDLYSCTECGRCRVDCPTDITKKPLAHKQLNLDLKAHLYDVGRPMVAVAAAKRAAGTASGADGAENGEEEDNGKTVMTGGAISTDTIWACTTCGYCEQRCPVLIENVPRIIEMRRHLVLEKAEMPAELANTLRNLERQSNPWGVGARKRGDWAKGLDVPTFGEAPDTEYLFYVGCAGSFDDRYMKVTRTLVKLFLQAGVSFGILGADEQCCGDAARRAGNEYLAQTQIEANIEMFKELGVKKIVTNCPHGFHTFKYEYPEFGGQFEVVHAAQLLAQLVDQGKLKPAKSLPRTVTLHDSCYLARHHGVIDEPRAVLTHLPGTVVREPERHGKWTFCCGGGGGRMWLEEKIGDRINLHRFDELSKTSPDVICTCCPFCMTMMADAAKDTGKSEQIRVFDLAELLDQALAEEAQA